MDNSIDFFIHLYLKCNVFGQTYYITTTHVCMTFVFAFLVIFAIIANRAIRKADAEKVPSPFVNFVELMVESLDNLVIGTMGELHGPKFANYIGTIFAFILTCNLSGIFGLRPPTADYGVTFPLAIVSFLLIQFNGFRYQKFGKITGLFQPIFVFFPINVISELATPISLSLRLFGNIVSGTVMITILYGLLPKFALLVWPAGLHVYLDVFSGCLQAYVFCILTMVFVANAIGDAENA